MSAGRAKLRHRETGKKVAIGDGVSLRWVPFFDNNPYLVQPGQSTAGAEWIVDYPGRRPYIDYAATLQLNKLSPHVSRKNKYGHQWVWNMTHKAEPAEFFMSERENEYARAMITFEKYVIVEPYIKLKAPPSKKWPFGYYQSVVNFLESSNVQFVQFDMGQPLLRGVYSVKTNFRQACVWLKGAAAFLGNEGALHHASAAVGIPAVVIFGAFIPPSVTGYPSHKNFFVNNPYVLGQRIHSGVGDLALRSIKPEKVADALAEFL